MPSSIKILFLGASPDDRVRQAVLEELNEIDEELSRFDDRFDLKPHLESQASKLPRLLMRIKPHIVHFSGHGTHAGELVFLDEHRNPSPADPLTIARTFQILQGSVRCVVLNACYSQRQAEEIAKYVPAVIGMPDKIEQSEALAFSKGFYEALGFGRSIEDAFDLAKLRAELTNVATSKTPLLIKHRTHTTSSLKHSRFTHELDRTLHWQVLQTTCDSRPNHHSFILHGATKQNLEFFLTRVLRYFKRPEGRRHRIVSVSSDLDQRRAVTAEDWGLHLRAALSATDWSLGQALQDATLNEAVMFVFCHGSRPLRARRDTDTVGFDEAEQAGFCEFLRAYFPRHLAEAKPNHPVRLVVPIEYPEYSLAESDDPLLEAADAALQAAQGIEHERVVELEQPRWSEIWESIKAIYKHVEHRAPPTAVAEACRQAYETARGMTFAELADAIAAELDFDVSTQHDH